MVISFNKLHNQILKLKDIAEKKASQVDESNFKKYGPLFDELIKFIKTKKCLLYGGYAINSILPKKLKFYGETMLPDLDVMSTDGEKLTKEVVAHFRKVGLKFTSSTEALHPGTHKVYSEGIQLLDITTITNKAYKRLSKNGVKLDSGLKTVDPYYLKMTLHILLSQPQDSSRWSKVLERLVAIYTTYPANTGVGCKKTFKSEADSLTASEDVLTALDESTNWFAEHEYVMFGTDVMVEMIDLLPNTKKLLPSGRPFIFKGIAPVSALVEKDETEQIAKKMLTMVGKDTFKLDVYQPDDFLPAHTHIVHIASGQPIISVYEAPACVSYINYKNMRVASIHTLIRMTMCHEFSKSDSASLYKCFSNVLAVLVLDTLAGKKQKSKLLEQFHVDCYGYQPGLVTLRRMRLNRGKK